MNKEKLFGISVILAIYIIVISCASNKHAVRSNIPEIKYDAAAFDYVYVEAVKQKLLGNGGDALKYLEQCIKINPESDAAYYQMAQIVLSTGDLTNGKNYALKAYNLDDKNLWYVMMLSGIYYQEGNIDSAIILYEKTVSYYPDKQNIQISLATLYSEKKDYEKALIIYKQLEEKYGMNENTTYGYIQNMILAGKLEQAFKKTEEVIKLFPANIQFYALLAEIYGDKGEKEKAKDVYQKLLDENPNNPQIQLSICDFLIKERRFEDLYLMLTPVILNTGITREDKIALFARIIEIKELPDEAIDKTVLSLMVLEATYPKDDIIPLLRAELFENVKRDSEAIERLEEIVTDNPDNYYACEKLLLLYLKTQNYDKLMVRGGECATRFNRSFLVKLLYANGALEKKKYDIAIDELRKAEILAGDNKEYLLQVLTMRADVYYRMNEYTKSFETFDSAIKLDSDDITLLNNYAYYLAEQDMNLKKAEEMARKVVEKEKDNATYMDTYAWVLYKRGKTRDAARIMEAILVNKENQNAEYYEHYGYIMQTLKNCNKAVESWTQAIKLDSSKSDLNKEIENCKKK